MSLLKIFIVLLGIVSTILISGIYPTAALVIMGLGMTFLFLLFKDVS